MNETTLGLRYDGLRFDRFCFESIDAILSKTVHTDLGDSLQRVFMELCNCSILLLSEM